MCASKRQICQQTINHVDTNRTALCPLFMVLRASCFHLTCILHLLLLTFLTKVPMVPPFAVWVCKKTNSTFPFARNVGIMLLPAALAQVMNRQISWKVPKVTNKCTLKLRSHGFFGSLISNPRSDLTSEVVWRPQWPRKSKNWDNRDNMHMDIGVIEVTDFKSEVRFDLQGHLEAAMTSEI